MPSRFLNPTAESIDAIDPAWAWAPFEPSATQPWNLPLAAHLLRRAGFAPTWAELQQAIADGLQPTLERLLAGGPDSDSFYEQSRITLQPLLATGNVEHLPAWWLFALLQSPHPLREKMTLFWHGHFATSAAKVDKIDLMARQNALFRQHALGKLAPLLLEASRDPAMLLWLDSATNHKAHPNENFAREVMELFCLGIGNYTEQDIKEAARSFTGWEVRRDRFWFNRGQHDAGSKSLLGQRGNWNGDDVIRILLAQPAAGRFLVRKLFRYFGSDTGELPPQLLDPLARGFRDQQYDLSWLLRTMLGSKLFFSPQVIGQKVKSPIELAVGLLRSLESSTNMYALADDLKSLGHGLFFPPNVKGWDGGAEWINSASLLARANLVWGLISGSDSRYKRRPPLVELVNRHAGRSGAMSALWFVELLLGSPVPPAVQVQLAALAASRDSDPHMGYARIVHAIATLPEFHVC